MLWYETALTFAAGAVSMAIVWRLWVLRRWLRLTRPRATPIECECECEECSECREVD